MNLSIYKKIIQKEKAVLSMIPNDCSCSACTQTREQIKKQLGLKKYYRITR